MASPAEQMGDWFPAWFRKHREAKGLSQDRAAAALDTTKTTVQNWESGKHLPYGRTLIRIAMLFGEGFPFEGPPDDSDTPG